MRTWGFLLSLAQTASLFRYVTAEPYNTFDGPGFPACNNVAKVVYPKSIPEMVTIVKDAVATKTPIRASGNAHMWYDTMCSDDPKTIIVKTEAVNQIYDLSLGSNGVGTVWVEAGVTFVQVAEWLHARNAALGYTLVNWNITIAGTIAMGAHRSSLKEDSQVSAAALQIEFINGKGEVVIVKRDTSDTWLAATTSLGLMGIISRVQIQIYSDYKVYANQTIIDEEDVFNSDIYKTIIPYVTANYWWWPGLKKFHLRTYNPVPLSTPGDAFQNTFSMTEFEAGVAKTLLNSGKVLASSNFAAESLFYTIWSSPNFHDKKTDQSLLFWPVYGYSYDVLIGGLYPGQKAAWDNGLNGYTLELAVPIPLATTVLRRVRQLFDKAAKEGKPVTATYRSGINIKFGKPLDSFLGQTNQRVGNRTADWSKGVMMFDFPSFAPSIGDRKRYNEQWYLDLARILVDEFPVRPHWTKCTREVLKNSVKNLSQDSLNRFAKVRKQFDPDGIFKSYVGETLGVM